MVIRPVVSEILGGVVPPQMLLHCQKEQMLLTVKEKCPYVLKTIGKFSNDIACFVENEGKVCFNGVLICNILLKLNCTVGSDKFANLTFSQQFVQMGPT